MTVRNKDAGEQIVALLGSMFTMILMRFLALMLVSWPGQWIWNDFLVPAVSVVNPVGYWQMVAISWLIVLLTYKEMKYEKS